METPAPHIGTTASGRQLPRLRPARHPVGQQPTASTGAEPACEAYRSQAGRYDQRTGAFRHWRELLVDQLPARRGDTVLDNVRLLAAPAALAHVFDHLRLGAPVAAAGGKWPSPWLWPLPVWVAYLYAPFVNDVTGFDRPWRLLAQFVPNLRVHELAFSTGYLALGHAGAMASGDSGPATPRPAGRRCSDGRPWSTPRLG